MADNNSVHGEEFVKKLAISMFNSQYGKKINSDDCRIKSVPTNYGRAKGYEIWTLRSEDNFRLRIYFDFSVDVGFEEYRIELDNDLKFPGGTGDEIYVTIGRIPLALLEQGVKFTWLNDRSDIDRIMRFVSNRQPIRLASGAGFLHSVG